MDIRKFLILIALFVTSFFSANAQKQSDDLFHAMWIYNIADGVTWQNQETFSTFKIGVFGAAEVAKELKKITDGKKLKNKTIEIFSFKKFNEIDYDIQILFISKSENGLLDIISSEALQNSILILTDRVKPEELKYTVINFLSLNEGKKRFEINKENAQKQGLILSKTILKLGGSEDDLRQLTNTTEAELEEQKKELEIKKQELNEQIKLISEQELRIENQREELKNKEKLITLKEREIKLQNRRLDSMTAEISIQKQYLEANLLVLNTQQELISKQQDDYLKQKKLVDSTDNALITKQSEIKKIDQKLNESKKIILTQKDEFNLLLALFGVIALLTFVAVSGYFKKRKINRRLNEQNVEINNQREELIAQSEEMRRQNEYITEQNEHITAGIRYAQTIQTAILPHIRDLNFTLDTFVIYKPKDIVSGDFYWYAHFPAKKSKPETFYYAVADCTGHGVPGAFMSMIGTRLLNEIVFQNKILNPAEILETVDAKISVALQQETSGNQDGMDIVICKIECIDTLERRVTYAGAKRPLYLYRHDTADFVKFNATRRSIGGLKKKSKNIAFEQTSIQTKAGDRLWLCSDGIIDQNNTNRERYGSPRFEQTLIAVADKNSEVQHITLCQSLDEFKGSEAQRDDITVIGVRL